MLSLLTPLANHRRRSSLLLPSQLRGSKRLPCNSYRQRRYSWRSMLLRHSMLCILALLARLPSKVWLLPIRPSSTLLHSLLHGSQIRWLLLLIYSTPVLFHPLLGRSMLCCATSNRGLWCQQRLCSMPLLTIATCS